MTKKPDAKALLAALQGKSDDDDLPPVRPAPPAAPVALVAPESEAEAAPDLRPTPQPAKAAKPVARAKIKAPRSELKHIGGYLDDETVEKVALLRIRLKLENSELLKLAIDDLFRKHSAKRAFGDA
jgi:hypothetical protein